MTDDTPTSDDEPATKSLLDGLLGQQSSGVSPHDHSSADQGGETLRPTHVATAETPRVDVRRYGVVGDGETDDSAAFQAAADAATPRGVLHVPATLDVYLASGVEIDCGADDDALLDGTAEQTPFALQVDGTITPEPGIGDAIHLHHAVQPEVSLRVQGGGEGPDADSFLHVTDTLGGVYEGFATEYDGTVLEFTRGDTRLAGVEVGVLRGQRVGREVLMRGPDDGLLGAEGGVGTVEDVWGYPRKAMEFHNVRGLKIDQYENVVVSGFTTRGNRFVGCEDVAIDKFAVGGNADIDSLLEFRDCRHVEVGAVFAHAAPSYGVVIDGVQHGNFDRLFINNSGAVGVDYRQTGALETGDNQVRIDARAQADVPLAVRESVTGADHYFTGTMKGGNSPAVVESSAASRVVFHDATLQGQSTASQGVSLPADNDVYLYDCNLNAPDTLPKLQNGVGVAEGTAATPDAGNWPTGAVVEYTDTDGGENSGLYQLFPSGWRQLATDPADTAPGTATATETPSGPTETGATTTESGGGNGGAAGFGAGTALVTLAAGALAAARHGDWDE